VLLIEHANLAGWYARCCVPTVIAITDAVDAPVGRQAVVAVTTPSA
jgi:hypothetical protein